MPHGASRVAHGARRMSVVAARIDLIQDETRKGPVRVPFARALHFTIQGEKHTMSQVKGGTPVLADRFPVELVF